MKNNSKIAYWIQTAESDLVTAEKLFQSGEYHWALFLGHLVLEKAIKAYFCKFIDDTPPRIHDLVKLAKVSNLKLDNNKVYFYNRVNDFNIEARYPDEKMTFYKVATKEFAYENLELIKQELQWIKSQIEL